VKLAIVHEGISEAQVTYVHARRTLQGRLTLVFYTISCGL